MGPMLIFFCLSVYVFAIKFHSSKTIYNTELKCVSKIFGKKL